MVMSCQMEERRTQKNFNGFDEIPEKGDQIESDLLETIHREKNDKKQRTYFQNTVAAVTDNDAITIIGDHQRQIKAWQQ